MPPLSSLSSSSLLSRPQKFPRQGTNFSSYARIPSCFACKTFSPKRCKITRLLRPFLRKKRGRLNACPPLYSEIRLMIRGRTYNQRWTGIRCCAGCHCPCWFCSHPGCNVRRTRNRGTHKRRRRGYRALWSGKNWSRWYLSFLIWSLRRNPLSACSLWWYQYISFCRNINNRFNIV